MHKQLNRANTILAWVMLLLVVSPVLTPFSSADVSGRSSPDFSVTVFTLDQAGSVWDNGDLILEADSHVAMITVANTGGAAGSVSISLVHKGSPVAGESVIQSIDLGSMAASSTSNPILIQFNATTGDDQTLFARVSSSVDSNSANNEQRMDFHVRSYHNGSTLSDTLPVAQGGQPNARLTNSVHSLTANVVNDGVMDISAAMELVFYEVGTPSNTFTLWSNTLTLESGSIANPAQADDLLVSLDATSTTGLWNMTAKVYYNGTSWQEVETIASRDVQFSDYIAELASPNDRTTEPGMSTTLTFILKNTGSASDSFSIQVSSLLGWADTSQNGMSTAIISPGASTTVQITVDVPASAARSEVDTITLQLTSVSDSYQLTGMTRVMAGELYAATVTLPSSVTMITPGQEAELIAVLENIGNVPAAFDLTAGLGVSASNWTLELSTTTTSIIQVGETVNVALTVIAPPIQLPLDLSEFNRAGDSLAVWIQAQPVDGGMPAFDSSNVEVRPVIVVDPGLPVEQIDLTPEEVIAARDGLGLEEILGLEVEVRHNLVTDLSETVDANIAVGDIEFTAKNNGGFSEADRWSAQVSPANLTGLSLGVTQPASFGIQGPADAFPLAGTLRIPVTATPTLGGVHQGSGVVASPVTRNLTITIPTVLDADILENGPLDAELGIQTDFGINFANIGNDRTSYRLIIEDDLPDEWIATIDTGVQGSTPVNIIDNLSADVADHPIGGSTHISAFTLSVTTDPLAPADTLQPLTIRVEERDSGAFITSHTIPIRVGEFVNASLSPTNQSIDLTQYENPLTRVKILNNGNTPTTYNVWLDDSNSSEVSFELESPDELVIAAGYEDSVKVRINPTVNASSDDFYMATLWVSTDTGLNLSANIVANISEDHSLYVDADETVAVVPGSTQAVNFSLTNNGNLQETVNVNITVEGDWQVTPPSQQFVLPIDALLDGQVDVTIPPLGGVDELENGAVHKMWIEVTSEETGAVLGNRSVDLVVGALFLIDVENWPSEMKFYRQGSRTFEVQVMNTGNEDVVVDVDYEINKPGLDIPSVDWSVDSNAPTQLTLPRGILVDFTFTVSGEEFEPDLTLAADLHVTFTPTDAEVEGSASLMSELVMSRLFELSDIELRPESDDGPMDVELLYSHIPDDASTSVAYELELCDADRLMDFSGTQLMAEDYPWNFSVIVGNNTYELDLDANCDSGQNQNVTRILLPERAAWDTSVPIHVRVDAPDRPNIFPGDGWDLTFRLYHPDEHNGYSVYTEDTFTFALDVFADPSIPEDGITVEGELSEGTESVISVDVYNGGTASAIGVGVAMECTGVTVVQAPGKIFILGANEQRTLNFLVRADNLNWYDKTADVECKATLTADIWNKNVEGNDEGIYKGEVVSNSWGLSPMAFFVLFAISLISSFFLLRLGSQNEKLRLGGIYLGLFALGCSFHILSIPYWGPAVLTVAVLWLWRMTWKSAEEFRMIHEDYQRARKGISTIYANHKEALSQRRGNLTTILALPVFGMLGVVLGSAEFLGTESNMISFLTYLVVAIAGVWFLLKASDRLYGDLYGRLTDVEVKATRIERDLGDPARLLNELADEGFDLSQIFDEGTHEEDVTVAEMSTAIIDGEVMDDA